jgi:hypothetical protein
MSVIDYERCKQELSDLKLEQRRLPDAISSAVTASDAMELVRLKQREANLPMEIFAAEVMLRKANVTRLKAAVAEAYNKLDGARINSKQIDERSVACIRVLDEERATINAEGLAALSAVYGIQNEIYRLNAELTKAERLLSGLLAA